jgi:hypothetical protein
MSADDLRLRALAAGLTLLSGGLMVLAGYLGHTESWAAVFITIPGGLVILAAFAVARRAEGAPVGGLRTVRAGTMATTLASGGVMLLAGYAGAAWSWALAGVLAAVGGVLITIAFGLDRDPHAGHDAVAGG